MKLKLFGLLFLGLASMLPAQVSIGISIGPPPPPRVVYVRPACPGPEFMWVEGYWYPVGHRYRWHEGYWTRAPFAGALWIAPRWEEGRFYEGYWEGRHERVMHDHRWDRDHDRDWHDHDHDHGRGHGHHDRDDR